MIADIEDPPRSRGPGIVLGIALAAIPTVAIFGFLLPEFVGAVVSSSQELDSRLRDQEGYMRQLCENPEVPRDQALCGCVLAVEFPALDCQEEFRPWLVDRARAACDQRLKDATTFCVCVQTVGEDAAAAVEPPIRRKTLQNMDRCLALPDAPTLEQLHPTSS